MELHLTVVFGDGISGSWAVHQGSPSNEILVALCDYLWRDQRMLLQTPAPCLSPCDVLFRLGTLLSWLSSLDVVLWPWTGMENLRGTVAVFLATEEELTCTGSVWHGSTAHLCMSCVGLSRRQLHRTHTTMCWMAQPLKLEMATGYFSRGFPCHHHESLSSSLWLWSALSPVSCWC